MNLRKMWKERLTKHSSLVTVLACIVVVASTSVCSSLGAGRLVQTHLSGVSTVAFNFPIGGFQYRPPPSVDFLKLETDLSARAVTILDGYGIRVDTGSDQDLTLDLTFERDLAEKGILVFNAQLTFSESAILLRNVTSADSPPVRVTSWSRAILFRAPEADPGSAIANVAETLLLEFAQRVAQAKESSAKTDNHRPRD